MQLPKCFTENVSQEKNMIPKTINDEMEHDRDRRLFFDAFPGVKTFQLFDDRKIKDRLLAKIFHVTDQMPQRYIARLEELNDIGAGVYMCINETDSKGRKAENIKRVRACFADFDNPSTKVPTFKIEPSMAIESSLSKFHVYFFSDNIPIEGFTGLQKALAYNCGSDPKIHDLPRIMRVPGFNHMKAEPFLTRIVSYTGLKYDYSVLCDVFPPEPRKKWSAPQWQPENNQYPNDKPFTGSYGSSAGNRNCDLAKIIGGMLKNNRDWGYIEQECFKHNAYSHPPLSDAEVRAVLKSCRRYT